MMVNDADDDDNINYNNDMSHATVNKNHDDISSPVSNMLQWQVYL